MAAQMARRRLIRIGVLGGTFNPVHTGHLLIAQDALEQFGLDRALFVPCCRPPHKPGGGLAAAAHRVAMVRAAVRGDRRFEVSELEIRRGGVSYTVDTARALRAAYPGAEIAFIIGSDSLLELRYWRSIGELLRLSRFVTLARPGWATAALAPQALGLPAPWGGRLLAEVRVGHAIDISSTDIRRRVAEGRSIRYLVPRAVAAYIARHGLYRAGLT